jgi:hypothetical protein
MNRGRFQSVIEVNSPIECEISKIGSRAALDGLQSEFNDNEQFFRTSSDEPILESVPEPGISDVVSTEEFKASCASYFEVA